MMYITAAIVLAAVRWLHMCSPYDRNADYYYPGRPFMIITFMSSLVLLPYVINPLSIDAFLLVKVYFLPVDIFLMTQMLFGYFAGIMRRERWIRYLLLTSLPLVMLLLAAFVLAVLPGEQIADPHIFRIADLVNDIFGAVSTIICLVALWKVREWALRFDEDEYSNPMDFPVNFAWSTITLVLICLVLLWITALTDSRLVMSFTELFLIIVIVFVLIASLHPNRHRRFEEPEPAAGQPAIVHKAGSDLAKGTDSTSQSACESSVGTPISDKTAEEVFAAIRKVVEEEKAFLDPHLTLNDVAVRCGYNRTYVTMVIKSEFGGFFNYINSLRLDYADDYRLHHPDAPVSEIVYESGFGSRQTYYNVKSRLRPDA